MKKWIPISLIVLAVAGLAIFAGNYQNLCADQNAKEDCCMMKKKAVAANAKEECCSENQECKEKHDDCCRAHATVNDNKTTSHKERKQCNHKASAHKEGKCEKACCAEA